MTQKKKNPSKETEKTELYKMEDTLSALRSLMLSQSPPLDALVVPSEDYHQVHHPFCIIPLIVLLDPASSLFFFFQFSALFSNPVDLYFLT